MRRTLLIVDDEEGVIGAIQQTLEHCDYTMIATTDPRRALEILGSDLPIDLLITDLFMPAMAGETLLQKGRTIRPGLKAVLTTGLASDREVRRWRAKGEVVIPKPWLDDEFVNAVESALR